MAKEQGVAEEVVVVGTTPHPFRDLYHALLRLSWVYTLALIAVVYLAINALFAVLYLMIGGIEGARPYSFLDAFFFSVQTMGTIGYGAMSPKSVPANTLMVLQSVVGLVITALATGLIFAKFSLTSSRVVFTRHVTIALWDGVPTLSFRLGNDRGSTIVDAQLRLALIRTEKTKEGVTFYRMLDLALARERSPAVSRSWTVMHPIDEKSPLFGLDPKALAATESEFIATVVGVDDTSLQPVHARYRWEHSSVVWGARHADVLAELPDGRIQLDISKFHEVVPTTPTPDFPYPR
jgi:inward rectifier potassium channel